MHCGGTVTDGGQEGAHKTPNGEEQNGASQHVRKGAQNGVSRRTAKGGFGHDAGMYAALKAQHVLQVVPWRRAVHAFSADGL